MGEVVFLEDVQFRREHERMSAQNLVAEYDFYERKLEGELEDEWRELYQRRFQILRNLMGIEAAG